MCDWSNGDRRALDEKATVDRDFERDAGHLRIAPNMAYRNAERISSRNTSIRKGIKRTGD
jgi:hypothetical protein